MKTVWKMAVALALIGLIVWQRMEINALEAKYDDLRARQSEVERLLDDLPRYFEVALERHRQRMFAFMEGHKDD